MQLEWNDASDGSRSEFRGGQPRDFCLIYPVRAFVQQPFDEDRRRDRNWETAITARDGGLSPSLASSKIDAEVELRIDAERIVAALGGKVVWQ